MKPENVNIPPVTNGPEVQPDNLTPSIDRLPPLSQPETGLNTGGERHEQAGELSAAQADAAAAAAGAPLPVQPSVVDPAIDDTGLGATPLVAANDDLIEKEWVDKAKSIITKTPSDPHARGEQAGALRKDYLRKRYGKELGAAS